jgi:heme/copper-type cytochrome/quinol oxidase subunit 4
MSKPTIFQSSLLLPAFFFSGLILAGHQSVFNKVLLIIPPRYGVSVGAIGAIGHIFAVLIQLMAIIVVCQLLYAIHLSERGYSGGKCFCMFMVFDAATIFCIYIALVMV